MDALLEFRAALDKIDAAVATFTGRAGDAVTCHKGCDACCVDGLSVLPVEAAAISAFVDEHAPVWNAKGHGHCAFLDETGACAVYAARPMLCRTHGLALKVGSPEARGSLRSEAEQSEGPGAKPKALAKLRIVSDDVTVCELNYTTRSPAPAETLDAEKLLALLTVVDARFRQAQGVALERVPLRTLAAASAATKA